MWSNQYTQKNVEGNSGGEIPPSAPVFNFAVCLANAERLAKLETFIPNMEEKLGDMDKKLDRILDHPCAQCQNQNELTRLSTEVKWVKRVGYSIIGACGVTGLAAITAFIEGWVK
jgi:hypothetical protein